MANNYLHKAKAVGKDEFYTQYSDIEREMNAYYTYDNNVFKDKIILCPCDDPERSNFTRYFIMNFERFGLKKLISTSYAKGMFDFEDMFVNADVREDDLHGRVLIVTKENISEIDINAVQYEYLRGNGDFHTKEVSRFRDEVDMIITNPPFSLFREFLAWVREGNKKFALIGNQNAITYKEVFPLIKENELWLGNGFPGNVGYFESPYEDVAKSMQHKEGLIRVAGVMWFTNLEHGNRHVWMELRTMLENIEYNKKFRNKIESDYNGCYYLKYDNYDAIEVPVTEAIPSDYDGVMGVPITFLDKYNPNQFEIIKFRKGADGKDLAVNGKCPYFRILIRKKK